MTLLSCKTLSGGGQGTVMGNREDHCLLACSSPTNSQHLCYLTGMFPYPQLDSRFSGTIGWIAMISFADIHTPFGINCNNLSDLLTSI